MYELGKMVKSIIRQVRRKSSNQLYVNIPTDTELKDGDYVAIKKVVIE